jgi:Protein of unknown function (DUF2852)
MPIAAGVLMLLGFWAWWPLGLIILMTLAFWAWWPLGLAVLAFMIGSGRMGCWNHHGNGGWDHPMNRWQSKMERMQDKMDRMRARMDRVRGGGTSGGQWWGQPRSSGNRAFDDYRAETLRRLEEEQREFKDFLERLRFAKDRAEFDQFMNERRGGFHDQGSQPSAN